MPLEKLEAVFRLMVDEQRFIALAQWQRDLAERLSSLKGRDGEDNPTFKARCREMEQEQRQIREAFDTLLNDIDDHIQRLPNDVDLAKLRESAIKFRKRRARQRRCRSHGRSRIGLDRICSYTRL